MIKAASDANESAVCELDDVTAFPWSTARLIHFVRRTLPEIERDALLGMFSFRFGLGLKRKNPAGWLGLSCRI